MRVRNEHFKLLARYDYDTGLMAGQCFAKLNKAYPGAAPSRTTVQRWFLSFKADASDDIQRRVVTNSLNEEAARSAAAASSSSKTRPSTSIIEVKLE